MRVLCLIFLLAGLGLGLGGTGRGRAAPSDPTANAGWEEIGVGSASGGGISNGSSGAFDPTLAIGPDGAPVVAWEGSNDGREFVYIRRWNGSAWVEIGSGSATDGGINDNVTWVGNPSLAIDVDNTPIVAWYDLADWNDEIFVRRWNGLAWAEMGTGSASGGGISSNEGYSITPSLAIEPDGSPMVAWMDTEPGPDIYFRRWNGSAWVELGSGSASGGGISKTGNAVDPSLAIAPSGMPIVAWEDNSSGNSEIYVRRWNGSAWVEMGTGSASGGGISKNTGSSNAPSLAIGTDGAPVVTWTDNTTVNREIYVRRWNGSAWVEMGAGSATGGGISNVSGFSGTGSPALAIGPDGAPVIAWWDYYQYNYKIYVRRWNGLAWVEMGPGSASGGGISNTGGATAPAVAIGSDGIPVVAWSDNSSGTDQIYIRRYQATCYPLSRTHTGNGSNPIATPANSTGCAAGQYTAGQAISLTAAPAAGHRVKNWSGTNNNSSTTTTNSLIMPAADHTVSVAYETIPTTTYRAFAPLVLDVPYVPPPCWAGPNEAEPNNTLEAAHGPLCRGVAFRGLPNDRWDMYYLETTRAGDITATLTNYFGGGMQLHLYYNAIGGKPSYLDTEDSDGLQAALRGAQPGRYYIAIYTETPNTTETRRYTLQIGFP